MTTKISSIRLPRKKFVSKLRSSPNNPAVGLTTRRWLNRNARDNIILDHRSLGILERSLQRCARVNPGGMVFDLAVSLGARLDTALMAGSVAEMYYTVCSLTDDIQDGEVDDYLGDVPFPLQINAASHLLCLIAVRAEDFSRSLDIEDGSAIVSRLYRTGAAMLNGQHMEIIRDPWDVETYEKVALLSAGEQFGSYHWLAAIAAGAPVRPWTEFGRAFGALLQYVTDHESNDSRLTTLPRDDVLALRSRMIDRLESSAFDLGDEAQQRVREIVDRCP